MSDDEQFDYVESVMDVAPVVLGVYPRSGASAGLCLHLLKGARDGLWRAGGSDPVRFDHRPLLRLRAGAGLSERICGGRLRSES